MFLIYRLEHLDWFSVEIWTAYAGCSNWSAFNEYLANRANQHSRFSRAFWYASQTLCKRFVNKTTFVFEEREKETNSSFSKQRWLLTQLVMVVGGFVMLFLLVLEVFRVCKSFWFCLVTLGFKVSNFVSKGSLSPVHKQIVPDSI